MKDQHKQIKGYRDLSQEEIDLMNKIKALAEQVGELVSEVASKNDCLNQKDVSIADKQVYDDAVDWANNAKTNLQVGFMQLTRAVAKPTTF